MTILSYKFSLLKREDLINETQTFSWMEHISHFYWDILYKHILQLLFKYKLKEPYFNI